MSYWKSIFNKFNLTINLYISLLINIALSIILPLAAMHMISLPIFLRGFAIAFPVSTIIALMIPINKLGDRLASALGLKPDTAPFRMVSTALFSLILGTFMSFLMTAVNAGIGPWFLAAWWSVYGWALLSVYLSALLGVFTAFPVAVRLCGPPPGMPGGKPEQKR